MDVKSASGRKRVGLCMTCNNAADCVYRLRRGFDAAYCEMFDGASFPADNGSGRGDTKSKILYPGGSISKAGSLVPKGLCQNCQHFETCMLPKPEGGVWHCEEYY